MFRNKREMKRNDTVYYIINVFQCTAWDAFDYSSRLAISVRLEFNGRHNISPIPGENNK